MSIWVKAPSNIALIKYWGKKDKSLQIPYNGSVSMGLNLLHTLTHTELTDSKMELSFDGKLLATSDPRYQRVCRFINWIKSEYNFKSNLKIFTSNSFYSDCGIASSASGFCALTISSLLSFTGSKSFEDLDRSGFSLDTLENISRMGSGSSCRSFKPGFVYWKVEDDGHQSVEKINDNGWKLSDTVVVISHEPKKISSSQGHDLAVKSPFFNQRQSELLDRIPKLVCAIEDNNIKALGALIEQESDSLYQVMQSTGINYRSDKCLDFIRNFVLLRDSLGIDAYYTLDAGQCVHIICESCDQPRLVKELKKRFEYELLEDSIGDGASIYEDG